MKKILFLLLVTISSYAQTYQNPTFGTVTTKTAPTVTSVDYLASVSTTGIIGKIDPINLPFSNVRNVQNPIYYKGKNIYWFGDSYTAGSGASPTSNRFTTLVSNALGAIEVNQGVAGTTIQKRVPINYMAGPNMVDNVVNIPTKTASMAMLVFAFGLNDMGQTAPDYTTANYKTDYQTVLNNAFSKGWLPNQVLIIPAYYIGSAGYAAYATITGNTAPDVTRHLAFIQAAKEVAEANGTMYFDIYQDQKKNDTSLISGDNIHPTNAGYAYIANDVLQYLGADKLSITTDASYSSGSGFIPKINVNKLDNSFLYQNTIGIGLATIDPKAGLHIHSASANSTMLMSHTGTTDAIGRGVSLALDTSLNYMINNRENGGVSWYTNNIERLGSTATGNTYVRNGKFGINTTAPNFQQHINDTGANDVYTQYTNLTSGTTTGDGFIIGINNSLNVEIANKENGFMRFHTNNTEKLRIHASGGVSIGNTTDTGAGTLNVTGAVFAPTATAGTNTTQVATTAFVQATTRPYKVYTALFSQSGTSAPTVTVLENTLSGAIVWTYTGIGDYLGTLTSAFTSAKTTVTINYGDSVGTVSGRIGGSRASANTVRVWAVSNGVASNDTILNGVIEIRVYN